MEIYDVIIIGSGPAGLTAGIYTSRASLKTLIMAGEKWGGQLMLTTTVENFPGFPDGIEGTTLMENMKKQAEKFGAKIVFENADKITVDGSQFTVNSEQGTTMNSRAVIVATGADTQWLGLPNEQRLIGHGVSTCATCDAFFYKNKKVAVIGGGDSACEEALFLSKFAAEVILIHRRDTLRASKIMQDRVKENPKIKILFNTEVVDVLGENKVEGLVLKNLEPRTYNLATNGVFVAIGHKVNDQFVKQLSGTEGVFIAGDCVDTKYKQAITAAASGTMAAMDAEKWLNN